MATTCYLKQPLSSWNSAYSYMNPTRSVLALKTSVTNTTASGTKIQATNTAGGTALKWVSKPITSAVTVSGTVTFNIWAKESSNSANAGIRVELFRYTGGSEAGSAFAAATFGAPTELTTTIGAKNWTVSPTSTNFAAGDRIVAYIYVVNVGTMGGGFTVTVDYGGPTASADGESYVQFTEAITFDKEAEFVQGVNGTGTTLTLPGTSAAGNLVVTYASFHTQANGSLSVADNNSNSYSPTAESPKNFGGTTYKGSLHYAKNITGGVAVAVTFTVTGTGSAFDEGCVAEYADVDTASPLDVHQAGGGTGTSLTSTAQTSTVTNAIIISGFDATAGTQSAGTNFVLRLVSSGNIEDRSVTATGSYSASASTSSSADWGILYGIFAWGTQPVTVASGSGFPFLLPLMGCGS